MLSRIPRKSTRIDNFCFWRHIFTTNDWRFLIEYPFKANISITVIYTHVLPIPSAKRLMHACPDPEEINPNRDYSCLTAHFHYKRLQISKRIPFQMKHTHCCYLYSCLTQTQCKALNARLPWSRKNRPESRFLVFDDTFSLNDQYTFNFTLAGDEWDMSPSSLSWWRRWSLIFFFFLIYDRFI